MSKELNAKMLDLINAAGEMVKNFTESVDSANTKIGDVVRKTSEKMGECKIDKVNDQTVVQDSRKKWCKD